MSIFTYKEMLACLLIFLLFGSMLFSFYFPLVFLFKDSKKALLHTMPVSIAFAVLLGYIFYCLDLLTYFPVVYLFAVIIINILTLCYLRACKLKHRSSTKINKLFFVSIIILFVGIIYILFYDAVTNLAPGTIDAYNHFKFIYQDFVNNGYCSYALYPPGFHILVYPISELVSQEYVYRFIGSIIGLFFMVQLFLCSRDIFSSKRSIVFLFYLMLLPIFGIFIQQIMGFFPTLLIMIMIVYWTLLIISGRLGEIPVWLVIFEAIAGGLIAPHFFVMFALGVIALWLFALLLKKRVQIISKKNLIYAFIISLVGIATGFVHVIIQAPILHRGTSFPVIESVSGNGDSLLLSDNTIYAHLFNSYFGQHYVAPILGTAVDLFTIKKIRGLDGLMAIGGYLVIILSVAILVYSYIKKKKELCVISILILVYGISVQTGIGEMSTYRGRSGYMLIFLTIVLVAMIYDLYIDRYVKNKIYIALPAILVLAVLYPPQYYRAYRVETYKPIYDIAQEYQNRSITVYAKDQQLEILSKNINTEILSIENIENCQTDVCVIVLENYFVSDPTVSQQALPGDNSYTKFYADAEVASAQNDALNKKIHDSAIYGQYELYYSSNNVEIFYLTRGE